MKSKYLVGPWGIFIFALLLVVIILILGNQSFKAAQKATFDEFNQRQLVLAAEATNGIELYCDRSSDSLGCKIWDRSKW